MRWRGATGAEVLALSSSARRLRVRELAPDSTPTVARSAGSASSATLAPRATTGIALLLNGADHHARQRDHAGRRSRARATPPRRARVQASSLRSRCARDRRRGAHATTPRSSPASCATRTATRGRCRARSARARTQKRAQRDRRANARARRRAVDRAARRRGGGATRARAACAHAWRTLLEGASARHALRHVDRRRGRTRSTLDTPIVEEQCTRTSRGCGHALVGHDVERARRDAIEWRPVVVVRNRAARARGGVVELTLAADDRRHRRRTGLGDAPGRTAATGADGGWTACRCRYCARAERVALTESPRAYPDADRRGRGAAPSAGWSRWRDTPW